MNRISRIWQQVQKNTRRYGFANLLYDFALRAVNTVVPFKILRAVYVDEPHPDFLEIPAPYTGTWLTPASLREWSKDRATQLSATFSMMRFLKATNATASFMVASSPPTAGMREAQRPQTRAWCCTSRPATSTSTRGSRTTFIAASDCMPSA